ncbi:MAG TPA: thiamine pyrophosphate-binding protein [Gammaproteobacteria bacterium]|nr:thiamine pyrophosphate-binding protein [Gammaproteobacteria bacterium]
MNEPRRTRAPAARKRAQRQPTIGEYLIQRLQALGLEDIFGIPGDFVLGFYGLLENSPIRIIGTTNELNAGYAADAYARLRGIGAVCVTYSVGGLSLVNAVAGAYAEKSPVIVISGAPGVDERAGDPLLHHRVGAFSTQREVFEKITVAAASLEDPHTAFRDIDRCLDLAMTMKRPVYLELPRDRVDVRPAHPHLRRTLQHRSDAAALEEALAEASAMVAAAKQPVIYAGVEVHRFGLRRQLVAFAERHRIPICATLLSKSVVSERHPLYLGIYEGAMGRAAVRRYVESSDCLIMLGAMLTDIDLGIYTARLDPRRWVFASSEDLRIRHHHYHGVRFPDFIDGLLAAPIKVKARRLPRMAHEAPSPYRPKPAARITNARLFARLDELLEDGVVVVSDVGDSLFGASDLVIHRDTEFLSPAYYTSMGFACPAAVGVQVANRRLRPLVIVGDGAFQMTGQELSTAVRLGFNPIVIVMNNRGYTTERFLQEGPFNDIHDWRYHLLPEVYGGGQGFEVHTEGELETALVAALRADALCLLNVHLAPDDISPALARLTETLKKRV